MIARNVYIPNCTVEEAEEILIERHCNTIDHNSQVKDFQFKDGILLYRGEKTGFTETAFQQFCMKLGTPHNYLSKLQMKNPELFGDCMNFHLSELPEKELLVRLDYFDEVPTVRGVLSNRYKTINNFDVFNIIQENRPELLNHEKGFSFWLTDNKFSIQAVDHSQKPMLVKENDECYGGYGINNSETGFYTYNIDSYIWRMWCSNGAKSLRKNEAIKVRHTTKLDDLTEYTLKGIEQIQGQVEKSLENMKKTIDIPVTEQDIELFNKKYTFTKKEQKKIWDRYALEKPSESLFSLVNALTFIGTHDKDIAIEKRLAYQETAGTLIEKMAV